MNVDCDFKKYREELARIPEITPDDARRLSARLRAFMVEVERRAVVGVARVPPMPAPRRETPPPGVFLSLEGFSA